MVRTGGRIEIQKDASGDPKIWVGRGSVHFDSPCEIEPWYRLTPRDILHGCFCVVDGIMPLGKVIKRDSAPASRST